ncbi:MAG: hypothetical protein A3J65_00030 [Candidatus Buchananbacteria bacterium RIFCSPHIGHO2_02_FULL_45_11b]|uniref:Type 4 fimbrial biogenesis protein PilX N-terminal domain-containing protein n=3 Tax=Candidatus Buchananiibacteriota TaxID=1817903 RepID=A0A1G1Y4Z6_9BACT|nr:MAG: hypothetical protein A2663_04155 [Candidatus Buchananbacteria bacterium RIFCSPHIGHO2_01_FULL_46_12]OGY50322.1 MAG: hypothetical protein A3J65_00030 [Candidatus Buchananbacteria bacterium RIFCSPHIGHO2_02_FULL_45_11b]OGY57454.1 MAG: hypothetical protein A3H67_02265 [Candidatus Buchananbacteria bacterium RIFCSPLOWO2_02_FULL_46_11b]
MALGSKKQSGVILLLVILIVTAILSTSAIFGALILREIQQSRLIDQSMQAFYLAESGLERALHQVRRLEAVWDCGSMAAGSFCQADGSCSVISPRLSCITKSQGNLFWPKGDWDIAVNNEKEVAVNLPAGESVQIDLFNPYKTGEAQTQIESFLVIGQANVNTTIYGELNNLTWLLGGTADCSLPAPSWPTISRNFLPIIYDESSGYSSSGYRTAICDKSSLDCLPINPNCSYVLRLSNNVFPDPLPGIFKISIYDKTEEPMAEENKLDIPSRLDIGAKAIFGNSSQLVRAKTPMRPPLSGLYDFVVFSEQPIVK